MTDENCPIQTLFERVMRGDRSPNRSHDGKREPEGTYTRGYKTEMVSAAMVYGGYRIEAVHTTLSTMSLMADVCCKRFSLKIFNGRFVIFEAERGGECRTKSFGPRELHLGDCVIPAGNWITLRGAVPEIFVAPPA